MSAAPQANGNEIACAPVATQSAQQRYLEVDLLKSAGIVAVVVIHSLRGFWVPDFSDRELFIGQVTRFGVPAFLAVSGFLYAAPAVSAARLRGRMSRILVPYGVASLLAIAWGLVAGPLSLPPTELLRGLGAESPEAQMTLGISLDLLLGNAFGPYYYVFVIVTFILMTPLLARFPPAVPGLVLFAVLAQGYIESGALGWFALFWYSRNPLLWAAYFLIGWWIGLHAEACKRRVCELRGPLIGMAASSLIACVAFQAFRQAGDFSHAVVQGIAWLGVYATLSLLFFIGCGRSTRSRWIATLSDLTYTIYLYHLFFLYPLRDAVADLAVPYETWPLAVTAVGSLAASVGLGLGLRALLGARARTLFGAS